MVTVFETNRAIVASVSGQAFFIIGLLAAWEFRRYSRLPLARPLWMLAAFGFQYALAEWGQLFIPIQASYLPDALTQTLWLLRLALMAAAFGALIQFGIELLPPRSRSRLRAVPPVLFAAWIGLALGGGGTLWDLGLTLAMSEAQARVLLALPGGLICALGLFFQERYLLPVGGPGLARWLRAAAGSAALSGLTLGLMVPPIGPWAGTEWLLGAPAEVWRALAGLQLEQDRSLEEAEHRVIAAQARERLGRELSDNVVQHLYAVGLLLEEVASRDPADHQVHHALAELDTSMSTLQHFIQDGETVPSMPPNEAEQRAGEGARA